MPTNWTSQRDSIGDLRITEDNNSRITEDGSFMVSQTITWSERLSNAISWLGRSKPTTTYSNRNAVGDSRITEDGSQRITEDGLFNRILQTIDWLIREPFLSTEDGLRIITEDGDDIVVYGADKTNWVTRVKP